MSHTWPWPPDRPSNLWMESGGRGYMDGGKDPPGCYFSSEHMRAVYIYWYPYFPQLHPRPSQSNTVQTPSIYPQPESRPPSYSQPYLPSPSRAYTPSQSLPESRLPSYSQPHLPSPSQTHIPSQSLPVITSSSSSRMPISSLLNAPIMPSLHPTASPNTNHYRPSAYYDTRAPSPQSSRIHSNSGPDIQDNTTSSISSTEAVVQIKCSYQVLVRPQVRSSAPPKTKAQAESYTTILALQTLTRSEFMNACLTEHHKHEDYNLATPNGPPFSIHWTGSTGGRAGRIPVKDDRQYKLAIDQISRCNTSKANFRVIVEFDLEEMKGWESRKRHHADSASTEEDGVELSSKAPRLTDFSHDEQLVGHYIIKIQEKWPCTEHKGEHGEAGTCWKDANNQHVGINNRVKKSWAETIAAGTHTIAEPPNINGIETTRNGVPSVHPRGRGPRPSSVRTIAQPEASGATIQAALLATATATLARLARSRSHSPSRHRSHHRSHSHRRSRSHYRSRSHRRHRLLTPPSSPLKAPDPEIQNIKACLQSYFDLESIDWRDFKSAFNDKSYSPDLIPAIELSEIMNLTGCNEGTALRFRLFCTKWVDRKKKEILRRGQ